MIKLFESFKEIEDICQEYRIKNYTINSDGSIDVNENVNLSNNQLTKLPLKFNRVTGYFDCYGNQLKSLEGCPKEVGRSFICHTNLLTSLEGAPRKVDGNFFCDHNLLTSLQDGPQEVSGNFECDRNQLTSLEGAPRKVGGFYCNNNKIFTFEGAPEYIDDEFFCEHNLINEIWILFGDYSKIELFNYYDIIREVDGRPAIVLDRLNDFLEEIEKPTVKMVSGYLNI